MKPQTAQLTAVPSIQRTLSLISVQPLPLLSDDQVILHLEEHLNHHFSRMPHQEAQALSQALQCLRLARDVPATKPLSAPSLCRSTFFFGLTAGAFMATMIASAVTIYLLH